MTKLSKYFQLEEFIKSDTADALGIDNTPSQEAIVNITRLHDNCMEKIRKCLQAPVYISSGYRCKKLNTEVGGSSTSQHLKGMACDFTVKGQSCEAMFNWCRRNLVFDQLILEENDGVKWVHISYNKNNNRRQCMKYKNGTYINV